jgi:uncharacterized protein YndB with AHSA1/START domain
MQTTIPALVIRRTFQATPQRVFEAWTDPDTARQFLCPEAMTIPEARFDVRVGGEFRVVMRPTSGEDFVARGVYREVRPNERLVMTWTWEEDDASEEWETLLTEDLRPHGACTELILTHERLSSAESRERHEEGWTSMLDRMQTLR